MHLLGAVLLLVFAISCGKSNSSAGMPITKKRVLPIDGSNIAGLYMAKFFTVNSKVTGSLPGSATVQRKEDKFYAYVRLFGGAPEAWHQQNVYEGDRCPNMDDDLNRDGYIDIVEGNRVWGKVLIPLDSNLVSQAAGRNIYPVADTAGTYFYERVTSFEKMFNDLKTEDKTTDDNVIKLRPDQGLDIEGRVVVVQGTDGSVVYPETVASTQNAPVHQTFPITCGILSRVTEIPGTPHTEEIPGEVGDVEESESPENDDWVPETNEDSEMEEEDNDDPWYERVIDWWRSRWSRARGSRRQTWGDGGRSIF